MGATAWQPICLPTDLCCNSERRTKVVLFINSWFKSASLVLSTHQPMDAHEYANALCLLSIFCSNLLVLMWFLVLTSICLQGFEWAKGVREASRTITLPSEMFSYCASSCFSTGFSGVFSCCGSSSFSSGFRSQVFEGTSVFFLVYH
jgi:hypothetical protein